MNQILGSAIFTVVLALTGCATQTPDVRADANAVAAPPADESSVDPDEAIVQEGLRMIEAGQLVEAIEGPFADVIRRNEEKYAGSKQRVYSARGLKDNLLYLFMVTNEKPPVSAITLGPAWAMAHWASGYAFSEMGRYDDAIVELNKALALAPMDSQYKIELAFAYQQKREWERALALYESAYAYAEVTALDVTDIQCRALRGQGFNLVELGRFDEARKAYRACLKLVPNEPKSMGELQYIEQQEHKAKVSKG